MLHKLNQYVYHFRKFGKAGLSYYSQFNSKKELIEVKLNETKYPFYIRNKTSDTAVFDQIFKHKEYRHNYKDGQIILDLGANIGLASIYYKTLFPNSKIIAVEPDESNFNLLVKNTQAYSDIICIQAGIWNKSTRLKLISSPSGHWAFRTQEDISGDIQTISIEDIISQYQLPKIDILKMDIESAEKEVFEAGIDNWITKVGCLVVELHDRYKPGCSKTVFKELSNYNFELHLRGENLFFTLL